MMWDLQTSLLPSSFREMKKEVWIGIGVVSVTAFMIAIPRDTRRKLTKPFRATFGIIFSVGGFVKNIATEIIWTCVDYLKTGGKKSSKYDDVLQIFYDYLVESGILSEFTDAFDDNFLLNAAILMKAQPTRTEQCGVKVPKGDTSLPPLDQSIRYVQYSTIVYGPAMIASAVVEGFEAEHFKELASDFLEGKINLDDIVHDDTSQFKQKKEQSESKEESDTNKNIDKNDKKEKYHMGEYLQNLVVVDHDAKSIVLAIRGTFSIRDAIVDLLAFSEPFCGGYAHAGIANAARNTWNRVKEPVKTALQNNPGYSLVITGHSLGAGAACLLTILLYHEKFAVSGGIKCFAYAPPPVFYPLDAMPEKSIDNITAYVHQDDIVPRLSINNVRRLLTTLVRINPDIDALKTTHKLKLFFDSKEPLPPSIIKVIKSAIAEPLAPRERAHPLVIPSKYIIWLSHVDQDDDEQNDSCKQDKDNRFDYSTTILDPSLFAKRIMDLCLTMLDDHMIPKYFISLQGLSPKSLR